MKRNKYSAGAVKFSFWFMEFRKVVQMLLSGKSFDDIKKLNEEENIFGASTPARAKMIYSTVTARIKSLDASFYQPFVDSDISTQKMFALSATLVHDTLFFDFVYEVVREKMIIGTNILSDADFSIFFKNKQEQYPEVEKFTDATIKRLARSYKTMLFEAGMINDTYGTEREIIKPVLDPVLKHWLDDFGYSQIAKALEGIR